MRNLILAMVMCAGCAPAAMDIPSSEGVSGGPAPMPLLEAPDETAVWYTPDSGMPPPPMEIEDDGEVALEDMTPEQLNALWFGRSGWYCCWTDVCDRLVRPRCDADEVPTTNGLQTCCSPDIGQCPESFRPPDDADAGAG